MQSSAPCYYFFMFQLIKYIVVVNISEFLKFHDVETLNSAENRRTTFSQLPRLEGRK